MRVTKILIAAIVASCSIGSGRAGEPYLRVLLEGSRLFDDCLACDRAPIDVAINGSFYLALTEATAEEATYALTDLELREALTGDGYHVVGDGKLRRNLAKEFLELTLNVRVGHPLFDEDAAILQSGTVGALHPWPTIDITADEPGDRNPLHRYVLHIVADFRDVNLQRYELSKESIFLDECLPCGRPTIPIPVVGSFYLGEIDANPLFSTFVVRKVDIHSADPAQGIAIGGFGSYKVGGEVAVVDAMELELSVGDVRGAILAQDLGIAVAPFPKIDAQLSHLNPATVFSVYSLHLIAEPSGGPPQDMPFRRGDSNGDGGVDISDAVALLGFLFLGVSLPDCLDARDCNGDRSVDVTDAISKLTYLFLEGPPPPGPGPDRCGEDPQGLGCLEYRCL